MGKGTDLWDDSALVNAFDHAMATYKEMHSNGDHGEPRMEGKFTSGTYESDFAGSEKKTRMHMEPGNSNNSISIDTTDAQMPYDYIKTVAGDLADQGNNICADVYDPIKTVAEDLSDQGNNICAVGHDPVPDQHSGSCCTDGNTYKYPDQQNTECDHLLRQYYELEEKKQRVMEQLHQANYWSYQTPAQSSTCQVPEVTGCTVTGHDLQTSCSLCTCHCVAVPFIPTSGCALGAQCAGGCSCYPAQMVCCSESRSNQVSVNPADHTKAVDDAVKVGMLAVERAINSIKMDTSESSNAQDDMSRGISSGTDLAAVLNAWYLAGFHTGRYLADHSKKNVHQ